MVGCLLLTLVANSLNGWTLVTLVSRGRVEHCQVQWLWLVNHHWGTLILSRCRGLREGCDILCAWGKVGSNCER